MKSIIGLAGVMESGKSTSFELIKKNFKGVKEFQIAGRFKDLGAEIFHIPRICFEDQNMKNAPFIKPVELTRDIVELVLFEYRIKGNKRIIEKYVGLKLDCPRAISKALGELGRDHDEDIHNKYVLSQIKKTNPDLAVVTDIRFPHEDAFFKKAPFFTETLFIYRTEKIENTKKAILEGTCHISESAVLGLLNTSTIVKNDSTIDKLEESLNFEVKRILAGDDLAYFISLGQNLKVA